MYKKHNFVFIADIYIHFYLRPKVIKQVTLVNNFKDKIANSFSKFCFSKILSLTSKHLQLIFSISVINRNG